MSVYVVYCEYFSVIFIDLRRGGWYTIKNKKTYIQNMMMKISTHLLDLPENCRLVRGSERRGVEFLSEWLR